MQERVRRSEKVNATCPFASRVIFWKGFLGYFSFNISLQRLCEILNRYRFDGIADDISQQVHDATSKIRLSLLDHSQLGITVQAGGPPFKNPIFPRIESRQWVSSIPNSSKVFFFSFFFYFFFLDKREIQLYPRYNVARARYLPFFPPFYAACWIIRGYLIFRFLFVSERVCNANCATCAQRVEWDN